MCGRARLTRVGHALCVAAAAQVVMAPVTDALADQEATALFTPMQTPWAVYGRPRSTREFALNNPPPGHFFGGVSFGAGVSFESFFFGVGFSLQ